MAATPKDSKTLRAELAAAEKREQAQRDADREAQREAEATEAAAVRAQYEIAVGNTKYWIGAGSTHDGGVEIDAMEWNSSQGSVALTREQTLELIEKLQTLIK